MLQLFQDTVGLTKHKDSHLLLSHHLVVVVLMVQTDQYLLLEFEVVVYLELRIYCIAKCLVKTEKVGTWAFFLAKPQVWCL